jgi:hypothetical protein
MNTQTETQPSASAFAQVGQGAVKAYDNLSGEVIHGLSGCLWVTLEGDIKDYILMEGECLAAPKEGKVLVSGPGFFGISRDGKSLDIRLAS